MPLIIFAFSFPSKKRLGFTAQIWQTAAVLESTAVPTASAVGIKKKGAPPCPTEKTINAKQAPLRPKRKT
jgi:hypothetical protein